MAREPQYSIAIEFDDFLTCFDLDYVIDTIDRIIDGVEPRDYFPYDDEFPYWYQRRFAGNSYVGITSVRRGSVVLTVLISSAVSSYVARRFFPAFRGGRVSEEIKRTARLSDEVLGQALKKINDHFERFVPLQRDRGGNIKSVKIRKKRTSTKKTDEPG